MKDSKFGVMTVFSTSSSKTEVKDKNGMTENVDGQSSIFCATREKLLQIERILFLVVVEKVTEDAGKLLEIVD